MKRKIFIIILSICAVLWLAFIFSNSMDNGSASTEKSSTVTEIVNTVAHALGYKGEISHKLVRKMAHFTEFFVLGLIVSADLAAIFYSRLKARLPLLFSVISASIPLSAICACADECIQLFSDGRAAQLTDVLIDSSGALCGYLLFAAGLLIFTLVSKKSLKNNAL